MLVGVGEGSNGVNIYPALVGGIKATFPHQDANVITASRGAFCSLGKPCLDRRAARFGREGWHDEPTQLDERIAWHVLRLLSWVDAAATGALFQDGDPLELPQFSKVASHKSLAFDSELADVSVIDPSGIWGFATTAPIAGAGNAFAMVQLLTACGKTLRRANWNSAINLHQERRDAIWVDVPSLPVLAPWQAPRQWKELRDCLSDDGLDLGAILEAAGVASRGRRDEDQPTMLALGFPLSERIGGVPERRHWLAVDRLRLSSRAVVRRGWRPRDQNWRLFDRMLADQSSNLVWVKTANWSPDQLRRRGQAEQSLRGKRILLLGAGSLGSIVADQLVRLGATRLSIIDPDVLEAGNLSRHALTVRSLGKPKAEALCEHLNAAAPDAHIQAIAGSFPPDANLSAVVRSHDLVIDCTGEDEVLRDLSAFDWGGEKLFISLAITWRAEGLFAFSATESVFPAEDMISRFKASPAPVVDQDDASVEAIGCWTPVFPASADDLHLWASFACSFIRESTGSTSRRCKYYRREADGSVGCRDV